MALENHYRSLIKAISWRVTGTIDTILISFLITGQAKWALTIGFVELFTKVFSTTSMNGFGTACPSAGSRASKILTFSTNALTP